MSKDNSSSRLHRRMEVSEQKGAQLIQFCMCFLFFLPNQNIKLDGQVCKEPRRLPPLLEGWVGEKWSWENIPLTLFYPPQSSQSSMLGFSMIDATLCKISTLTVLKNSCCVTLHLRGFQTQLKLRPGWPAERGVSLSRWSQGAQLDRMASQLNAALDHMHMAEHDSAFTIDWHQASQKHTWAKEKPDVVDEGVMGLDKWEGLRSFVGKKKWKSMCHIPGSTNYDLVLKVFSLRHSMWSGAMQLGCSAYSESDWLQMLGWQYIIKAHLR